MVWSKWKAAAMFAGLACAGLLCAGFVYSQQSGNPMPQAVGAKPSEVVTVQEPGQAPQHYVILKSYHLGDGRLVQEMRNLATGEVMTVVEKTAGPVSQKSSTGLIDWVRFKPASQPTEVVQDRSTPVQAGGTSNNASLMSWLKGTPQGPSGEMIQQQPVTGPVIAAQPDSGNNSSLVGWFKGGSPAAPVEVVQQYSGPVIARDDAKVQQVAGSKQMPSIATAPTTTPTPAGPTVVVKYRTVEEPGKAPVKCRVTNEWRTAQGQKATQLQALDTGEILTIVEMGPSGSADDKGEKMTATLYHWGHSTTAPQGVPTPPGAAFAPAMAMPSGRFEKSPYSVQPGTADPTATSYPVVTMPQQQPIPSSAVTLQPNPSPMVTTQQPVTMYKGTDTVVAPPANAMAKDDSQKTLVGAIGNLFSARNATSGNSPTLVAKNDVPQATDTAKAAQTLDMPNVAKKLPPPPPEDYKAQWSKPDPKVATSGLSTDTTPLPGSITVIPPAQPKMPGAPGDTGPSMLPGISTPISFGNTTPSLPPTTSMPSTQTGSSAKIDPLSRPEVFASSRAEDRAPTLKDLAKSPAASIPAASAPGYAKATDNPRFPLGTASVVAAANGGDPMYLPVPIVTVPQGKPPVPPTAQLPKPPPTPDQPVFTNAFSTPQTPEEMQYAAAMQQRQMMAMQSQVPMGYQGPMPPPSPMNVGQGCGMPMMPQGYPMPMMAQGYPMPMMPQGYGMPVSAQGYATTPMVPVQQAAAYANPAMDRPGLAAGGAMSVQQCIATLQTSIFPTQRETAIIQLCNCDWRINPQILQWVLTTAKEDPAGMVRMAAVSGLARMGAAGDAVTSTLNQLKSDADARVRMEAEKALTLIAPASGLQPTGGVIRQ